MTNQVSQLDNGCKILLFSEKITTNVGYIFFLRNPLAGMYYFDILVQNSHTTLSLDLSRVFPSQSEALYNWLTLRVDKSKQEKG